MMQAALAVFLLLLAQASQPVVEVAAGGSTDLSCTAFPSCECHHDSATLLQSRSHQALAVDFGPTCLQANLNNGTCVGDNKCFKCDLQGAQNLLPSDETRFPESRLLCDGDSSSTCSLNTTSLPIRFLEASQVMVCKGTGTCRDEWKVENVGAVCCSSPSNVGQTCYFSSFALQNNTLCQSDMCCDGVQVCSNSTMNGVESLLCKGYLACSDSTVGLERDLYCNETSDVNLAPSLSGGTCSRSWFDFTNGESNQHVVDCLGNGVCDGSFFTFDTNASVSMECDSNATGTGGGMGGACQNATITLAADVCLDLNCTQDVDCLNMVVNLNGGKCFFNNFGQQTRPNFVAVCTATNGTECGPIQREPICCKDEPDCGSCCAEPSTTTITTESPFEPSSSTTTSSTTSTTKPYPRNRRNRRNRREHRRNRRQNRRNRRQHARQYRYSM